MNKEDFLKELEKKLMEETKEYLESGCVEELVDIYQVLLAILRERDISFDQFELLRKNKANKKGEFKNRLFLSSVLETGIKE